MFLGSALASLSGLMVVRSWLPGENQCSNHTVLCAHSWPDRHALGIDVPLVLLPYPSARMQATQKQMKEALVEVEDTTNDYMEPN